MVCVHVWLCVLVSVWIIICVCVWVGVFVFVLVRRSGQAIIIAAAVVVLQGIVGSVWTD